MKQRLYTLDVAVVGPQTDKEFAEIKDHKDSVKIDFEYLGYADVWRISFRWEVPE